MSDLSTIIEHIYTSLHADNEGLDEHIASLKTLLISQKLPSVTLDAARIPQPNREGRKLLQSYFKKRGVNVVFGG